MGGGGIDRTAELLYFCSRAHRVSDGSGSAEQVSLGASPHDPCLRL